MKHFLFYQLLLIFCICIFTIGCHEEITNKEKNEEIEADSIKINPNYVPFDWNETQIISIDTTSNKYIIEFRNEVPLLNTNSIIVLDADTIIHVLKIKSSQKEGKQLIINADRADFCDIFWNTEFTLSTSTASILKSSAPNNIDENVFYPTKILIQDSTGNWVNTCKLRSKNISNNQITGRIIDHEIHFSKIDLYKNDDFHLYIRDISMLFGLDFTMQCSFSMDKKKIINEIIEQYRGKLINVNAYLNGVFNTEHFLQLDVFSNNKIEKTNYLVKRNIHAPISIKFIVYGVPIIITITTDMLADYTMDYSSNFSIYTGFSTKSNGSIGFKYSQYNNEINPDYNLENSIEIKSPTIEGYAELNEKTSIYPRVNISLYGVIGPYFDIKPYMRTQLSGGFKNNMFTVNDDFYAFNYGLYLGMDLKMGLNLFPLISQQMNVATPNINFIEKLGHKSPHFIKCLSKSKIFESEQKYTINFEVFDTLGIRKEIDLSYLPHVVKFEGDGELTDVFAPIVAGKVNAEFQPNTEKSILYARLYSTKGEILSEAVWQPINVETLETSNITTEKAICKGKLNADSMDVECLYGICYSDDNNNPTVENDFTITSTIEQNKIFQSELSGLKANTTYFYCAYIKIGNNIFYGDVKQFKTKFVDFKTGTFYCISNDPRFKSFEFDFTTNMYTTGSDGNSYLNNKDGSWNVGNYLNGAYSTVWAPDVIIDISCNKDNILRVCIDYLSTSHYLSHIFEYEIEFNGFDSGILSSNKFYYYVSYSPYAQTMEPPYDIQARVVNTTQQ